LDGAFFVKRSEVDLCFRFPAPERRLAFRRWRGDADTWRTAARDKLAELIALPGAGQSSVTQLRTTEHQGVRIDALVMALGDGLSLPAYLLRPQGEPSASAVMAIHGHGRVEPAVGQADDYHHCFALRLAQAGHLVLCPELRGFGALVDLAANDEGRRLDYWAWPGHKAYSLVTAGLLYGRTMIGDTVADLLRWEAWLAKAHGVTSLDVAGISYGGDLALTYPVFSQRVDRIMASGTLGSFDVIFDQCYNAPAHAIPGALQWLDRSDIAGLNAPRPILLHYGELDVPGPENHSASYNETVGPSVDELRAIYSVFGAANAIELAVTPAAHHEMDVALLLRFLR